MSVVATEPEVGISATARVTAEIDIHLRLPSAALEGRSLPTLLANIERVVNEVIYPSAEVAVLGWTATALRTALARLRDRGNSGQAAVIEAGLARSDGKVSRETALRLDNRDEAKYRAARRPDPAEAP